MIVSELWRCEAMELKEAGENYTRVLKHKRPKTQMLDLQREVVRLDSARHHREAGSTLRTSLRGHWLQVGAVMRRFDEAVSPS